MTAPAPPTIPLRDRVLAGQLVGAGAATEAIGALIAGTAPTLSAWFGPAGRDLASDPDALRLALDRDIAAIDRLLSSQVDAILHHARLARLEASWRGLAWLVLTTAEHMRVKVKVLGLSWAELVRDGERAIEFDQSRLFDKVYESEFGTPGGEPFGLLVGDYAIRHRRAADHPTDDIAALGRISAVAAASFSPFIVGVDPTLFGLEDFGELSGVRDLAGIFRGTEYDRFRALQNTEDSRFLGLVMPRIQVRIPHANDGSRVDRFVYAEQPAARAQRGWCNAVYGFAAIVSRAVAAHGWPADVKGTERDRAGGGLVLDLPSERYDADRAGVSPRYAIEVALTDRQEQDLAELGFIPLGWLRNTTEAAFGACRSLQSAKSYQGQNAAAANASARLSAQLSSILCVSRFAHFIKVIGRDRIGSFSTPEECEAMLQKWLTTYVNANTRAGAEMMARYPLAAARVQVSELPGRPGHYGCVIQLQPQFQLDDVAATFRLVTEVPTQKAA